MSAAMSRISQTPGERARARRRLRIAFAAGAVTDGLALVPMLFPPAAELAWGFQHPSEAYLFAMGYAASLMAGWTLLLTWAYARPVERRFVAVLTLLVIAGLAATEVVAVLRGTMLVRQVVRTWVLQIALGYLFATAYWVSRNTAGGEDAPAQT